MALTISNTEHLRITGAQLKLCEVAFDSSYPTGGESLTAANLGLSKILFLSASPKSGYFFEYDEDNAKLKAYTPTAEQTAVTTDKITITASGAANITDGQSCTVDADFRSAVDAAAGDEVANTTDLSAVTGVKLMVFGY